MWLDCQSYVVLCIHFGILNTDVFFKYNSNFKQTVAANMLNFEFNQDDHNCIVK